jgi:uncharacterized protein (UPF0335 family)
METTTMKTKLKTRMAGVKLRAFKAGHISDQEARAQGYDVKAVRKYHHMPRPKARKL